MTLLLLWNPQHEEKGLPHLLLDPGIQVDFFPRKPRLADGVKEETNGETERVFPGVTICHGQPALWSGDNRACFV